MEYTVSVKPSQPLTKARKQQFLDEHFLYEVRELNWCVIFYLDTQLHKVGINLDVERFLVNVALDHAFLHARNLAEFLYEGNNPEKYAHATAFLPRWSRSKPKL